VECYTTVPVLCHTQITVTFKALQLDITTTQFVELLWFTIHWQMADTEMHHSQGMCNEISSSAYHQSLYPVDQPNMTERTSALRHLTVDKLEGDLFSIGSDWMADCNRKLE